MQNIYPQYKPRLGTKRYKIGIVGAGDIVRNAHLPAYKKADFPVVGIYDIDIEKAKEAAKMFGLEKVYNTLESLLEDDEVEVVDIAVPAWVQKGIVSEVVKYGKHLLCQKPLASSYADAVDIVEMAEKAGVKLAVNQQMRWDPLIASCKDLIERGWIGEPYFINFQVSINTPFETWPWLVVNDQYDLSYHSIHYFDAIRYMIGTPKYVYSSLSKYPGDTVRPETRSIVVFEYEDEKRALISTNHRNWSDDTYATLRIEGTDGIIKGTIGLLYNYPHGRPDTLEYCSRKYYPNQWFTHIIEDLWIPDAFIGTMGELQRSVEEDDTPLNSGRDNLETLQIVNAGYLSMIEKRAVSPQEIIDMKPKKPIPFSGA